MRHSRQGQECDTETHSNTISAHFAVLHEARALHDGRIVTFNIQCFGGVFNKFVCARNVQGWLSVCCDVRVGGVCWCVCRMANSKRC